MLNLCEVEGCDEVAWLAARLNEEEAQEAGGGSYGYYLVRARARRGVGWLVLLLLSPQAEQRRGSGSLTPSCLSPPPYQIDDDTAEGHRHLHGAEHGAAQQGGPHRGPAAVRLRPVID